MFTWVDCEDSFPGSSIVRLTFPARGDMPPVRLTWWHGGMPPERPADPEPGRNRGFRVAHARLCLFGHSRALIVGAPRRAGNSSLGTTRP